jgi:hypothetical protein
MDDRFDVFDEWGNFIGRFTAIGSGANNCAVMLALLITGVVVSIIYMLFRLIVEGFKALFTGRFGMALLYWAIPLILIAGVLNLNYNNAGGFEGIKVTSEWASEMKRDITVSYSVNSCSDTNYCEMTYTVRSGYNEPITYQWAPTNIFDPATWESDSGSFMTCSGGPDGVVMKTLATGETDFLQCDIGPKMTSKKIRCIIVTTKAKMDQQGWKEKVKLCPNQ